MSHLCAEQKCRIPKVHSCSAKSSSGFERLKHQTFNTSLGVKIRLPDVLERQGLSLNLLSKRVMSLIFEKHLVVLEYFAASLKSLEYFENCSFKNY